MTYKNRIKPYLFILPSLVFIGIFFYYPVLTAIFSSFTDLKLGYKPNFIGLKNYLDVFTNKVLIVGFFNQLLLTGSDVFKSLFFPLLAAELLFFIRYKKLADFLKTLFVVPMLVPGIVIILMWIYIYNQNFGLINSVLDFVGSGQFKHAWLREESTALWSVIGMGFPFVSGLYFLIFHAGLGQISGEIAEAATIDGCKSIQIVRYIHLPLIVPHMASVCTLSIIGSLQDFVKILVTTKGGPGYSTYTPALYMYDTAFQSQQMGYASAIGVILFIIIISLTLISMKASKKVSDH